MFVLPLFVPVLFNNAKQYGLWIFILFLLATVCLFCFDICFWCFGVGGVYPLALFIVLDL